MSILNMENLSYNYKGCEAEVLKSINYEFEKGNIYAIVGKSGAGKTTLLSLLSGLTTATFGKIVYDGKDLKNLDKYDYRSKMVGVIFQGYNLLTNLTAEENVILSLDISGKKIKDKKAVAKDMLRKVDIDETTAKRTTLKLSGGEQQRIAIARALSYNPDIILADEPTGNLDGETEKSIMQIFVSLAKEYNKAVIIVTHSPSVASYADHVIEINNGQITSTI
jgi:putative ABC transport system ATP-binding protein